MSFRRPRRRVRASETALRPLLPYFDAYPRFYDLYRAVEDHLVDSPSDIAMEVEEGYWLFEAGGHFFDMAGDLPVLSLLYTFDEEHVDILLAKARPPDERDLM